MTLPECQSLFDALDSGITVSQKFGRVYLAWDYGFGPNLRRWDAPEGSHFPTWHLQASWGSTRSGAYDQFVRRLQGKPVTPLSGFNYLVNGPAKLGGGPQGAALLAALTAVGWPTEVPCVLCGKSITSAGDWWTIGEKGKRISGPGCSMLDCREKVGAA